MPATKRIALQTLAFLTACAILIVLSLPGLQGPLVLDSVKLFALERLVDDYGNLAVFHTPGFSGELQRIVSMATFVLDVQLRDGVSPTQFKAVNVGVHIVAASLVFLLTRLLVSTTEHRDKATILALATSVLWLLSPVNFNVVMYAVQRMAMLAALFIFAGLLFYAAGRLEVRQLRRWLYLALSGLVCLPLAALSKENGVLLIPLAFLVEIYLLHPVRPWFTRQQLLAAAVAGLAGAVLIAVLFVPGVFGADNRDFSLIERLMSQPRALVSYVWRILLPLGNDAGIYTDGFEVSRGFFSPISTVFAALACLVAIAFCVFCGTGRFRLVAFGLAFFFVGHAIESTIVPLELYFEHRNYLPDFGLYFALSSLLMITIPKRKWALVGLAVYGVWFVTISHARSQTWSSRETIATAAVRHNPQSARAWSAFAQLATDSRQFDLAETAIDTAIELTGTPNSRLQRLYLLCRSGKGISPDEYRSLLDNRRFGVSNELSQALANLLQLHESNECPQLRVPELVENLDRLAAQYRQAGGDAWVVEYYADSFLYTDGERQQAYKRLRDRLDGGHLESGLYLLELLIDEGEFDQARQTLDQIDTQFRETDLREYESLLRDFAGRINERE